MVHGLRSVVRSRRMLCETGPLRCSVAWAMRFDGLRAGLVNTHGEVFSAQSEQVLPDFIGQAGDSGEVAQRYGEFSRQLDALDLQVVQLALSPRHAWQLRLSNGMVLGLGREEMQQRLARFVAVYPYSLAAQAGSVRYVDMRYRNGFAVSGLTKRS